MTLEAAYYTSQIVAVIAIIGSLIAIYFQQLQTNRIARADMTQRVSSDYNDSLRELMVHPELAQIFRKVMFERTELTPRESTQILTYFNLTLKAHLDAFLLVRDGMVDERHLISTDHNTTWYLTAPAFAREWRRTQRIRLYPADFLAHVHARFAADYPDHDVSALIANNKTPT